MYILFFVIAVLLATLVMCYFESKKRKIHFLAAVLICILTTPLIGYFIISMFGIRNPPGCNWCGNKMNETEFCGLCGKNVEGSYRPGTFTLRNLIVIILCTFQYPVLSQTTDFSITGKVFDAETKKPVLNVNIVVAETFRGTITDTSGRFELKYDKKNPVIIFSHVTYEKKAIRINSDGENYVEIFLKPIVRQLPEAVIYSPDTEIIAKNQKNSVLDYCFSGDYLFILSLPLSVRGKKEMLALNQNLDTVSRSQIPENSSAFFEDCLGNTHLICSDKVYQFYLDSSEVAFYPPVEIDVFTGIFLNCVESDPGHLFYSEKAGSGKVNTQRFRFTSNNYMLNYFFISRNSGKKELLISIADAEMKNRKSEEQEFILRNERAGTYRTSHGKDFDRVFSETILFKEIYAPIFQRNDTIYVFDFIHSSLFSWPALTSPPGKIKIDFHEDKKWKSRMCCDKSTGKIYAFFEENGLTELKEVDLETAKLISGTQIPVSFPENIKTNKGYVYYLHRGKEDHDTKYLARIKL